MRSFVRGKNWVLGVCMYAAGSGLGSFASAEDPKNPASPSESKSVLDFTVKNIDGKDVKMADYAGDVLVIVNVASKCGYTDGHYKTLQPLYEKYNEQGLRVLAFPCNDFNKQEPGTSDDIKTFCSSKYRVTFNLFEKITVKGDDRAPLYDYLINHPDPNIKGDIKWNFQKYLVGRDGKVIARYYSDVSPDDPKFVAAVEGALKAPKPVKK